MIPGVSSALTAYGATVLATSSGEPVVPSVTGNPLLDLALDNVGPTLVLLLFLTGRLFTGDERKRLLDKLERTEQQRDALRDGYDERVIPLLTRTVDLVERLESRLERSQEDEPPVHRPRPSRPRGGSA